MIKPWTHVGTVLRLDAMEIADSAFETQGRRVGYADRWKTAIGARQTQHEDPYGISTDNRHMGSLAIAPQAAKHGLAGRKTCDRVAPDFDGHDMTRPGPVRLDRSALG
jgi:hypothetical protein